jgi:hypothetical protein
MAVRINPCHGCIIREGCELRAAWREKLSGLGLRSARFNCPKLASEVRVGRRITVLAPVSDYDTSEYGTSASRQEVKATITAVNKNHDFACVVDPGQLTEDDIYDEHSDVDKIRFWKFRKPTRIHKLLDEPDVKICENGNIRRNGVCDYRKDKQNQCACDYMAFMNRQYGDNVAVQSRVHDADLPGEILHGETDFAFLALPIEYES